MSKQPSTRCFFIETEEDETPDIKNRCHKKAVIALQFPKEKRIGHYCEKHAGQMAVWLSASMEENEA